MPSSMGYSHVSIVARQVEMMRLSTILSTLRESGLCIDRVALLEWVLKRHQTRIVSFRFLRLRFSPAILTDALRQGKDGKERSRYYSLGISYLNMGRTYKTTGASRTALADREVLKLAQEHDEPSFMEIGVSDGVSSLPMLERKDLFSQIVLSDKYNRFFEKKFIGGSFFLDANKRLLGIKFLCFYLKLSSRHPLNISKSSVIETVNPALSEYGITEIHGYDMFSDVAETKVDIIKCSNILNLSYFSPKDIVSAANNIARSLNDEGHIVISHNNEKYAETEAVLILKKQSGRLQPCMEVNSPDVAVYFGDDAVLSKDDKSRILFFIPSLEVGGAERQLVAIANGLAAGGHDVAIAVMYAGGELEQSLDGVRLFDLGKKGRWDIFSTGFRLVREVKAFRPNYVCSFLGTPNIFTSLLKWSLSPSRVIWFVRSSNMDLARYDSVVRFAGWAEARLATLPDKIILNSYAGMEYSEQRGFPKEKMIVIPNGFDLEAYHPCLECGAQLRKEWGVEDGLLVGMVARLDYMKDHETFLRSLEIVVKERDDVQFVIVGGGPRKLELIHLSKNLDVFDKIIWAGHRKDMLAVYNAIDICCLSSLSEGFPNVLGEAMCCGTPCVTTDAGDSRQLVGDTGIVVPVRSPQALADALLKMISRLEKGDIPDTRKRIDEEYSMQSMLRKMESMLAGESA